MPFENLKDVLTVADVANLLRVSRQTVYSMVRKQQIEHFRVGTGLRFSRAAIFRFIRIDEVKDETLGVSSFEASLPKSLHELYLVYDSMLNTHLHPLEVEIYKMRWNAKSYREIGSKFQVSPTAASKIYTAVSRKILHPAVSDQVRCLIADLCSKADLYGYDKGRIIRAAEQIDPGLGFYIYVVSGVRTLSQ